MTLCRLCGQPIKFEMNENGKWVPYDLDGVNHFNTCPEIKRRRELYRKNNDAQEYFFTCNCDCGCENRVENKGDKCLFCWAEHKQNLEVKHGKQKDKERDQAY